MRLVAYVRVSSASQQEAFGPMIQRAAIQKWAKAGGHKIVSWQEDTISGASELRNRVGWCEAAALVKAGKAAGIVVARLDRLARDVMVQELLLRKLSDLGGVILSARDGENEMLSSASNDPSRKLVRVIMGAISEYDREMTVDRLAAGRQAKAARGGYAHGAVPYGYRTVKGELVADPAEQAALARMKAMAAQGASTREIARVLAAEGYPTKRGGQWSSPTVARILNRLNREGSAA